MPVLSFDSIVVSVPCVSGPKRYLPSACLGQHERRNVLHHITGRFPRKGLVAIMGPSGSGKTTFLNAISNRMSIGGSSGMKSSGIVKVDDQVVPPDFFYSKSVSFVPQDTSLFSELTPRESVRFATSMIFPHASPEEIETRVQKTLTALGLAKCADTQVGNEMFRGISGGEKKRTSIAVSIVNEPEILFLDEPTTGLDSETADGVVRAITGLSKRKDGKEEEDSRLGAVQEYRPSQGVPAAESSEDEDGRIIIMTLHQPSSTTWSYLSHLVLLVQGYIVYNGPANAAMDFFVSCGFRRPLNANPADHFLDIVQCQEDDEDETEDGASGIVHLSPSIKTTDKKARAKYLAGKWCIEEREIKKRSGEGAMSKEDKLREKMVSYQEKKAKGLITDDSLDTAGMLTVHDEWAGHSPVKRFGHELKLLSKRAWMTFTRTRLMIPLKMVQILITAILIILLFTPLGNSQVSMLNRSGAMYLIIIIQIFASVLSVVMLFPEERGVYLNEQASRTYNVLPYFVSKLVIDIPVLTLTLFFFSLITYWPIGLQRDIGKFLMFFLVMEMVAISGHGLGLIVATGVASPAIAALMSPMVVAPFILFSRIAIPGNPSDKITPILRPLQIFSPFFWGLDALMATEFKGLKMACTDEELNAVPSVKYGIVFLCRYEFGEEVLQTYAISEDNYPYSFLMLCLIAFLTIAGSAALLKIMSMRVASCVEMDPPTRKVVEVE